ncbi:MAG: NAD(P)-binding protein [candidate division WOR-3 bacterium]|nr:NAD(P)-binding protein [candidate division WOR-3 bacterium]MDW8113406.1 NAD(P)-binding protein [candidate division WOR-3 bacterium]
MKKLDLKVKDYPELAISWETTLINKTGTWRTFYPKYFPKTPPCNYYCPANENIQKYIALSLKGEFEEAYFTILEKNPFPSITGRVCYHPCEIGCNRGNFDESIAIHAIERFLGDYGINFVESKRKIEKLTFDKKVAIIGSGPAGLSCAYYLLLKGVGVTIFEKESYPGGILFYGIPAYRLPKEIVKREVEKLTKRGAEFIFNKELGKDFSLDDLTKKYDAVFLAIGAQIEQELGVLNEDANGVLMGLDFLKAINLKRKIKYFGKNVLVIGGGNTAIDCARVALRKGAKVKILYRRTKEEMPAIREEVEEALKEGIEILFLTAPSKIIKDKKERVKGLECVKMKLSEEVDESGRRKPIPIKNSNFVIKCDTIIKAIGEKVDLAILPKEIIGKRTVLADEYGKTNIDKIFAGGDCVTGPKTVVEAIAYGRRAAYFILNYLKNFEIPKKESVSLVNYENLNTYYFEKQKRIEEDRLPVNKRKRNFKEIVATLTDQDVKYEAGRCFSCGVCNNCDNCYVFCPDLAVLKKNGEYEILYDYCKGCGVCAHECPRNVISMFFEEEK